jgi:hypothetical protein
MVRVDQDEAGCIRRDEITAGLCNFSPGRATF